MSEVQVLILTGLQVSQWTVFGSATLLLYDHAIHLGDEVSTGVDSSYPHPT